MYRSLLKTVADKSISILLLLIFSPIILVVLVILLYENNGTPIFFQERVGKAGTIFNIIKFKTMNNKKDSSGRLLPDKDRLTKPGRFIRSTSLDELPQLINVLKGDMSLVGPRPLLVNYVPLYNDFQARRHEVHPGITGWAQVNGRNSLSWDKKFELDVWYVDHVSFNLDLKILWMTILKVFKREGINAADATTMRPFTGNN